MRNFKIFLLGQFKPHTRFKFHSHRIFVKGGLAPRDRPPLREKPLLSRPRRDSSARCAAPPRNRRSSRRAIPRAGHGATPPRLPPDQSTPSFEGARENARDGEIPPLARGSPSSPRVGGPPWQEAPWTARGRCPSREISRIPPPHLGRGALTSRATAPRAGATQYSPIFAATTHPPNRGAAAPSSWRPPGTGSWSTCQSLYAWPFLS